MRRLLTCLAFTVIFSGSKAPDPIVSSDARMLAGVATHLEPMCLTEGRGAAHECIVTFSRSAGGRSVAVQPREIATGKRADLSSIFLWTRDKSDALLMYITTTNGRACRDKNAANVCTLSLSSEPGSKIAQVTITVENARDRSIISAGVFDWDLREFIVIRR